MCISSAEIYNFVCDVPSLETRSRCFRDRTSRWLGARFSACEWLSRWQPRSLSPHPSGRALRRCDVRSRVVVHDASLRGVQWICLFHLFGRSKSTADPFRMVRQCSRMFVTLQPGRKRGKSHIFSQIAALDHWPHFHPAPCLLTESRCALRCCVARLRKRTRERFEKVHSAG